MDSFATKGPDSLVDVIKHTSAASILSQTIVLGCFFSVVIPTFQPLVSNSSPTLRASRWFFSGLLGSAGNRISIFDFLNNFLDFLISLCHSSSTFTWHGIVDEEKRESEFDTTISLFADFAKDSILLAL
tara:strand:- start:150 stop:536 length:387 start_codon:yes stop_codon:yes gene_type:complete